MAKQPYIPFYLGDYLKDTRILPLNVRGGWVDLILYMWDNKTKGELIGTYDDFARLMSCSKEEAVLVIQTLNQKEIFAYTLLSDGSMKIESRKIKKMVQLSKTRKIAGMQGGNPNLLNQTDNQKDKLNPEIENEIENEIEDVIKKEKEEINIEFSKFWNLYDKKVGSKENCEKKWKKLKQEERIKIIETLPKFINSINDKQFLPYPETYINNKRWLDEVTDLGKQQTTHTPLKNIVSSKVEIYSGEFSNPKKN